MSISIIRLLDRADGFVKVSVMDTGEHVIAVAGEVHLERCISDLQERFAQVPLKVCEYYSTDHVMH